MKHNLFVLPTLTLFCALVVLPAFTGLAGGNYLNGSSFIKAANLPWFEDVAADNGFYNDIAVNPHYPGSGCIYNPAQVNGYLVVRP